MYTSQLPFLNGPLRRITVLNQALNQGGAGSRAVTSCRVLRAGVSAGPEQLLAVRDDFFRHNQAGPFLQKLAELSCPGLVICRPAGNIGEEPEFCVENLEREILDFTSCPFPVFQIITNFSMDAFSRFMELALTDLPEYENSVSEEFYGRLAPLGQNGAPAAEIVRLLSDYTGFSYNFCFSSEGDGLLPESGVPHLPLPRELRANGNPRSFCVPCSQDGRPCFAFSLPAPGDVLAGYLVADGMPAPSDLDRHMIGLVLPHLSVRYLAGMWSPGYRCLSRDVFFKKVLRGEFCRNMQAIMENCEALGIPYASPRQVAVLHLPELSGSVSARLTRDAVPLMPFRAEYTEMVDARNFLIIWSGEGLPRGREDALTCCAPLMRWLSGRFSQPQRGCVIGLSMVYENMSELFCCIHENINLLQIGRRIYPEQPLHHYRDYFCQRLLDQMSRHQVFQRAYSLFCESVRGLDEYAFQTLDALYGNEFSVSKTAAALFVHRSSLYKRIGHIRTAAGIDVEDSNDQALLNIFMAFRGQHLRQSAVFSTNTLLEAGLPVWEIDRGAEPGFSPNSQAIRKFGEKLCELTAQPFNWTTILNFLRQYVQYPVDIILNGSFTVVTKHNSLLLVNTGRLIQENFDEICAAESFYCVKKQEFIAVIFKVMSGRRILGFVAVHYHESQQLAPEQFRMLQMVLPYVAAAVRFHRRQYAGWMDEESFYRQILFSNVPFSDSAVKRIILYLGINPTAKRYVGILVYPEKWNSDAELIKNIKNIKSEIGGYLGARYGTVCLSDIAGRIVVVLTPLQPMQEPPVRLFADLLCHLEMKHDLPGIQVGISGVCTELSDLATVFNEAQFSVTCGRLLDPGGRVFPYQKYLPYHILCDMWGNEQLSQLYRTVVVPLLAYEEQNPRATLVPVMDALTSANFSAGAAACAIDVHRNTVYKKLEKAESLLRMDFSKAEDRLLAELAFYIHRIIGIQPETGTSLIWTS